MIYRLLHKAILSQSILLLFTFSALAQKTDFTYYETELSKVAPLLCNGSSDQDRKKANDERNEITTS